MNDRLRVGTAEIRLVSEIVVLTGMGALFSTYVFDAPLSLSLMGWYSIVKILH